MPLQSFFRQAFTTAALFALAGLLVVAWSRQRTGYGLDDVLAGRPVLASVSSGPMTPAERAPFTGTPVGEVNTSGASLLEMIDQEQTRLVAAVAPSVVLINTTKVQRLRGIDPYGRLRGVRRYVPGLGSGFIISKEGHVVTNYHVIEGVEEIQIVMHDGSKCLAQRVGEDRTTDIALLRIINPLVKEFPALPLVDSDQVRPGQMVFAIGNPFGLRESVSHGIISHRDRQLSDSDPPKFQTTAVINPGNSGGPLVNVRGEVVGVNVAIFAGQEDVRVWQGIGLAIPSNDVRRAIDRIRNGGRERVGYLGVQADTHSLNGLVDDSVIITRVVPGSPAEKAGLREGDVILSFGGQPVTRVGDLFTRINRRPIGDAVSMEIMRGSEKMTVSAVVADRDEVLSEEERMAERRDLREQIGIMVRNLSELERRQLPPDINGIVVTHVEPDSAADGVFYTKDLIYQFNDIPVESVEQFFSLVSSFKDRTFTLKYIQRGVSRTVKITMDQ